AAQKEGENRQRPALPRQVHVGDRDTALLQLLAPIVPRQHADHVDVEAAFLQARCGLKEVHLRAATAERRTDEADAMTRLGRTHAAASLRALKPLHSRL